MKPPIYLLNIGLGIRVGDDDYWRGEENYSDHQTWIRDASFGGLVGLVLRPSIADSPIVTIERVFVDRDAIVHARLVDARDDEIERLKSENLLLLSKIAGLGYQLVDRRAVAAPAATGKRPLSPPKP